MMYSPWIKHWKYCALYFKIITAPFYLKTFTRFFANSYDSIPNMPLYVEQCLYYAMTTSVHRMIKYIFFTPWMMVQTLNVSDGSEDDASQLFLDSTIYAQYETNVGK